MNNNSITNLIMFTIFLLVLLCTMIFMAIKYTIQYGVGVVKAIRKQIINKALLRN